MKRTLIFLSFFFLLAYTSGAQTKQVYQTNEETGEVTLEIIETKTIEKLSFRNTTKFSFNDKELETLFQGGTVKKVSDKMTKLFPPMFSFTETHVSLAGMVTKTEIHTKPTEFSWGYLLFCMVIPLLGIVLVGIKTPKEKTRYLFIYYLSMIGVAVAFVAVAAAGGNSGGVVAAAADTARGIAAGGIVVAFVAVAAAGGNPGGVVAAAVAAAGGIAAGIAGIVWVDGNLTIQYFIFIAVSCIVSFIVRHWYFKHKATKELMAQYS